MAGDNRAEGLQDLPHGLVKLLLTSVAAQHFVKDRLQLLVHTHDAMSFVAERLRCLRHRCRTRDIIPPVALLWRFPVQRRPEIDVTSDGEHTSASATGS